MTPEHKRELIRRLEKGEDISPEWARILFPPEKREYELVYHGKDREEDIIADTLAVPLQPVRTFGRNGVDWHNMLIFGDNIQAMKTLLEMKNSNMLCNADGSPGVRLIYIDPPFATRQEFRGTQDQKAYQDKLAGGRFLEFLRQRFVFLHRLLADNGLLYVHLDYRKSHYAKLLLDEIFGEQNFMNEIAWCYSERELATRHWNRKHDSIFVYAKDLNSDTHVFNWKEAAGEYSEGTYAKYEHKDKDGRLFQLRGRNISGSPWRGKHGIPLRVEKEHPEWVYRDYLDTKEGIRPRDWWSDIPFLNRAAGDRFDYPSAKTPLLLDRIIRVCSNKGDLVLDAFAGSGTTCAVAEKLGRRWIGIDCGKLSIYTIQKRMLTLSNGTGNKAHKLEAKPFTLFNAGLYDFSALKNLTWPDWRFFALHLFGARDEPHKISGIHFDGYRQGQSVIVFNHMEAKHKDARISEDTIQEIHDAVGSRVGSKVFIIAPALAFDFQQDYIDIDKVRYYALRIPYSIINELHRREFSALKQPSDEMAVNDTVEAVGFDFIHTPDLKIKYGVEKPKGELFAAGTLKIETFKSHATVREPVQKRGNLETLSMVMLDFDYDEQGKVFDLDAVYYADKLAEEGWKIRFPIENLGKKIMAVFVDIYGNEARVLIDAKEFGQTQRKHRRKK